MPIYRGSNLITKVYRGSTEVDKIYRGSTLVYEREQTFNDMFTAGTGVEMRLTGIVIGDDGVNNSFFFQVRDSNTVVHHGTVHSVGGNNGIQLTNPSNDAQIVFDGIRRRNTSNHDAQVRILSGNISEWGFDQQKSLYIGFGNEGFTAFLYRFPIVSTDPLASNRPPQDGWSSVEGTPRSIGVGGSFWNIDSDDSNYLLNQTVAGDRIFIAIANSGTITVVS